MSHAPLLLTIEDPDLYKDPYFPHNAFSIGPDLTKEARWIPGRRLREGKWDLFDGIKPTDLLQGSIGNCWLVAAMAVLAEYPQEVRAMFTRNGHRKRGVPGDGMYVIRLYDHATSRFVDLTVDEYIPYLPEEGHCCFAQPNGNILWVLILEKAMAKLFGSYSKLLYGNCAIAFRAFTGQENTRMWERNGTVWTESILVKGGMHFSQAQGTPETRAGDRFFETIRDYDARNYLQAASLKGDGQEKARPDGLVEGHAYSLLAVADIDNLWLVKMRNPWGNDQEWKGAWCDNDAMWQKHPEVKRALRPTFGPDGVFWMAWEDFANNFDCVYVCHKMMQGRRVSNVVTTLKGKEGLLTGEERAKVENDVAEHFRRADANNDGFLDIPELSGLMVDLGMPVAEVQRLMAAADRNKDGRVDLREFLRWIFKGSTKATRALKCLEGGDSADTPAAKELPKSPKEATVLKRSQKDMASLSPEVRDGQGSSTATEAIAKKTDVVQTPAEPPHGRGKTPARKGERRGPAGAKTAEKVSHSAEERELVAKEVRQIFNMWADADGDGFLDAEELTLLMEELGMSAGAQQLVKLADNNGDGKIDTQEFIAWIFSGTKLAEQGFDTALARVSRRGVAKPK
mmetsp:Transcript_3726/g.9609  ORF Transcript_3726/g.9609 Transcript_3726/m.9609 type:complete len:626 (-) Transcript_3726:135-2012(-)